MPAAYASQTRSAADGGMKMKNQSDCKGGQVCAPAWESGLTWKVVRQNEQTKSAGSESSGLKWAEGAQCRIRRTETAERRVTEKCNAEKHIAECRVTENSNAEKHITECRHAERAGQKRVKTDDIWTNAE